MDKVNKWKHSLKWCFLRYLPVCIIVVFLGSFIIGITTNYLQSWYRQIHPEVRLTDDISYAIQHSSDGKGELSYVYEEGEYLDNSNKKYFIIYWIISYAQVLLIALWAILCIAVSGLIFYKRELKQPIDILINAAKKISDNQLDFKLEYTKPNELGVLCKAFDEMRGTLYDNNREMWRLLEERKRLNSAFSHDLRTPLTVLKGYGDFLQKYVPDGKITEEKLLNVLSMMEDQIVRLEHYTQKMTAVHKLEDIIPKIKSVQSDVLKDNLTETGKFICLEKSFKIDFTTERESLNIDIELVMQVYENLVANAYRYCESSVWVVCCCDNGYLRISVVDDGTGFTDTALRSAAKPFFRDEKELNKTHFGLGLYISRIICEKCGGKLTVENCDIGGKVTAEFYVRTSVSTDL